MRGTIEIKRLSDNHQVIKWLFRSYCLELEVWTRNRTMITGNKELTIQCISKVKLWRTPGIAFEKRSKIDLKHLMRVAIGNPDGFDSLITALRELNLDSASV